ncbi:hypothetical protein SeLEV6574_g08382, partial [Synchytrium endobioticum]
MINSIRICYLMLCANMVIPHVIGLPMHAHIDIESRLDRKHPGSIGLETEVEPTCEPKYESFRFKVIPCGLCKVLLRELQSGVQAAQQAKMESERKHFLAIGAESIEAEAQDTETVQPLKDEQADPFFLPQLFAEMPQARDQTTRSLQLVPDRAGSVKDDSTIGVTPQSEVTRADNEDNGWDAARTASIMEPMGDGRRTDNDHDTNMLKTGGQESELELSTDYVADGHQNVENDETGGVPPSVPGSESRPGIFREVTLVDSHDRASDETSIAKDMSIVSDVPPSGSLEIVGDDVSIEDDESYEYDGFYED